MILIKNAKIYRMIGSTIENGYIIVDNGKIIEFGEDEPTDDNYEEMYDCQGGLLFPGLIDSHTHIGVLEEAIGFEGDDINESFDPITPHLRAIDAINHMDLAFADAIQAGVTCVATGPGSANVIGGQFAVIKTYGNTVDDMIIKHPAAIKVALGENPKSVYFHNKKSPITRMATAALLREYLYKAQDYMRKLELYNKKNDDKNKPEFDFKLECLVDVLLKRVPLKIHVHRADDILTAIRICKEFDVNYTLDHCTEGHLVVDILKENNISVIIGPTLVSKSKVELKNLTFKTPGLLSNNGVKIAIMTDHPCIPVQYLPICAALSVKNGMDEFEALKAITINAAEILGISDRVGSIEVGKDADIVVYNKHPFEYDTHTKMVMINGKIIYKNLNGN